MKVNDDIQQNDQSEEKPSRSVLGILTRWLLGVVLFCVVAFVGLGYLTNYLAGQLVKNQVEEYSNDLYTVQFDKVNIDWNESRIDLTNFRYTRLDPNSEVDTEIEYFTQLAKIKLESITGIYFQHALHVEEFVLESPSVSVNQTVKKHDNQEFSFKTGNLFKLVQGFVKSFAIDNFQVNHLQFDYRQTFSENPLHYHINDLTFGIRNFKLDSAAVVNNDQFFFTESVELKVENQSISMEDGVHEIYFDSLTLSTKRNNIEVHGFKLDTLAMANQHPKIGAVNRYHLNIPYCGIINLDFLKAYQNNVLSVDSIVFNDVWVNAELGSMKRDGSGKVKIDSAVNNGAIELLLDVFDRYELNRFEINRTQASLDFNEGNDKVKIKDLNFEFSGYVLDSMALVSEVYYPKFDGLKLQISSPVFNLPSGDQVLASQLKFSTYDSLLVVEDVQLKGVKNKRLQENNLKIEALEFHGINPKQILNDNEIIVDKINVLSPSFKIVKGDNRKNNSNFDIASFLDGSIKNIQVKTVKVIDGDIDFENGQTSIHKTHLTLNDFALNQKEIKRKRFLFSRRSRLRVEGVKTVIPGAQHVLQVGALSLDSRIGKLELKNWKILPDVEDSSTLKFAASGNGDLISVEGIALNKITNYKEVELRDLRINSVTADIDVFSRDTLSNDSIQDSVSVLAQFEELLLNGLNVTDVNVVLKKDGATVAKFSKGFVNSTVLQADSASLQSNELVLISDSLEFGFQNLYVPLNKIGHTMYVQSILQTKTSEFSVTGFNLRPFPGATIPDTVPRIIANVPQLHIDSFDIIGKGNIDTMHIGNILLNGPSMKLTSPKKKKNSRKPFSFPEKLPEDFIDHALKAIKLKGFEVQNGSLELKNKDLEVKFNELDLNSNNWFISKSSTWQPEKFLYADNFSLYLSELEYKIPGLKFDFQLDSINYSSNPNKLFINGVGFQSRKSKEDKTGAYLSFLLPKIEIENPNMYKYLTDSSLTVSSIKSYNGLLEADLYGGNKPDTNSKFSLPTEFPEFNGFSKIELHNLDINRMDVQLRTHKDGAITPLEMDHFNLEVDSFHVVPKEPMDSNRLFWSNDVRLGVQNVYTTVDQGLYEIGTDKFALSTKKDSIGLKGVSFVPTVPRMEYALHKGGYIKDVFNVNLRQLEIKDFNFFKLLYEGEVVGNQMVLTRPDLRVFKDKRNLVPPYKFKPVIPQMFKDVPVNITFDSVLVNGMNIRYDEFPVKGREPGKIILTNTNIKALNVSNDKRELQKDSTLTIEMKSKFLDEGNLSLNLEYNLLSKDNTFSMRTNMGGMDATKINPFIKPVYSAELLSANVDTLKMSVIGNDSIAGGKMGLYYEGLKFRFLNEDDNQHSKWIMTLIGNTFVKSKNKYHYFARDKSIFFERDTSKGWIGYLIRIELQGVQANAGLNKNQGKDAKKAEKEVWKDFEKTYGKQQKEIGKKDKKRDKELKKKRKKEAKAKKKADKIQKKLDKKE